MNKKIIYLLFVFVTVFFNNNLITCQRQQIPKYLEECYSNETFNGPQLPLTLPILIDIIQKIESALHATMDLKTLASTLLHRFKFDGIEFHKNINFKPGILPFSGTGFQRAKNEIVSEIIPGNFKAFPNKVLSLLERCIFHQMLSNTINEAESPQIDKLCAERPTEKISENLLREKKTCPVEQGVILTPFKTIAPGSIIAAIAAALQHRNVAVKLLFDIFSSSDRSKLDFNYNSEELDEKEVDIILPRHQMLLNKSMSFSSVFSTDAEVDNIWLATIAGELAELVVYQGPIVGPEMILGSAGFWNNTMRPQLFYLIQKNDDFDVTRAEIIGSIDGFIIAKHLKTWLSLFDNLKLSQILDMYYSSKGLIFDSIGACGRGRAFWSIASRAVMEEQVYAASQVLAYKKSIAHMTDKALKSIVTYAVNKFTNYVNNHLFPELHCIKERNYPRVEVFVVFDGAWSQDYTADFFAVLLDDIDVSKFGSKIGFLHGTTGEWLLNTTDSPSTVYEKLITRLNSITWPTNLDFSKNILHLNKYLTKKWEEKQKNHSIGSLSQVILFLAPRGLFNKNGEQQQILNSITQFKENHPDVNIVYFTIEKHSSSFQQFLVSEEDYLIDTLKITDISRKLLLTPKSLRPISCILNSSQNVRDQTEDYIKPQETIIYRLDPQWRTKTKEITMTVVSVAYGSLEVCSWSQMRNSVRKDHFNCKELSGHSEIQFMNVFDCKKDVNCPAVLYQIRGLFSLKKCAEIDCKSPDHIRFLLRLENLYCSHGKTLFPNTSMIFSILTIYIIFTYAILSK